MKVKNAFPVKMTDIYCTTLFSSLLIAAFTMTSFMNYKKVTACYFFCLLTLCCSAQEPKLMAPIGHSENVYAAAFSPDGKKAVTVSKDLTAKIWDTEYGRLLMEINSGGDASSFEIGRAEFSQGGDLIILQDLFGESCRIFEVNTGEQLWKDEVFGPISETSKRFSPDGKKIIFPGEKNTVDIYPVNGPDEPIMVLRGYKTGITNLAWSPDGKKIIAAGTDDAVAIWDAATGKKLLTVHLKKNTGPITGFVCSADNKYLLVCGSSNTIVLNMYTGKVLTTLDNAGSKDYHDSYQFSPGGKIITRLSGFQQNAKEPAMKESWDYSFNSITAWDEGTGKQLFSSDKIIVYDKSLLFSPDGKKMILCNKDSTVTVRNAATGAIVFTLAGFKNIVNDARFSPDGKKIVTASWENSVKLWDAATGNLVTDFTGHQAAVNDARFSKNGKKIITASEDNTAIIWNTVTGKAACALKGRLNTLYNTRFSPDGTAIILSSDKGLQELNLVNGKLLQLPGKAESQYEDFSPVMHELMSPDSLLRMIWAVTHLNIYNLQNPALNHDFNNKEEEGYKDVQFSPDSKKIVTTTRRNTIKLYELAKVGRFRYDSTQAFAGKKSTPPVFTLLTIDSADYFIQVPSGYYQSTPAAAKLLYYITKDLKIISFEQLDVKYNRPDKVLQAIGQADSSVISMYRNAYYKRVKKLGIDTTVFRDGLSVPEADFLNREAITAEQKKETLTLHIKGLDSTYKLDRYNIWVNEVPLYGQRGVSLRKNKSNRFEQTVTIHLSQGQNRIETAVTNTNGTESYRMPLLVNYTPAVTQKETTYFIGIGIDKFAEAKYNLNYSTKDIRDLAFTLKEKFGNSIIIDTLFNEKVTVSNVKALKKKLLQTTVNDKVIISYSGHGLLSKTYDYYLSTWAVNFDNPQQDGLPYDALESLLDSIPARKKLLLIDACHSGEVDKEEYQQATINQSALDSNHVVAKGVTVTNTSKTIGLTNSFELMQHLFVNVGNSTGATIIAAAAGTAYALEIGNLKNGVFTYCIIDAMHTYPTMKISDLKKIVGSRVQQLTNDMQHPTSRNEAITADWNLW